MKEKNSLHKALAGIFYFTPPHTLDSIDMKWFALYKYTVVVQTTILFFVWKTLSICYSSTRTSVSTP